MFLHNDIARHCEHPAVADDEAIPVSRHSLGLPGLPRRLRLLAMTAYISMQRSRVIRDCYAGNLWLPPRNNPIMSSRGACFMRRGDLRIRYLGETDGMKVQYDRAEGLNGE